MKKTQSVREGLRRLPIRPVYLVSMEHDGKRNIITIGMFAFFSGNPALVGIGVAPARYSYDLIRKSREYVINVVDERLMEAVRICGEYSGRDTDKFRKAKLTPVEGVKVSAPYIQECPVSLECKVVQEVETGDHVWFIGEVQATHVNEDYDWKQGLLFKWIGKDGFYYRVGKQMGKY
ncbi:MAG: flavin reductase family protein [Candidatus Bathyarchaeota archaeon]|nr:flavin reductase family protein [Candidatus Bathyarchaeota archaeon]